MALKLESKKNIVTKFHDLIKNSLSVVLADFRGINSNKINELRKIAREKSVHIFVLKNSLIYFAIKKTKFLCLEKFLYGPTLVVLSYKEFGIGARLLLDFFKNDPKFKIKGASFNGKLIEKDNISDLSDIPTYHEIISKFIFIILEISIVKLVRVISIIGKKR